MERSIYFIRCSLTGATKIGIADDVLKRRRELQTANPGVLTIVGCIPGNRSTEAAYHQKFAAKRLAGEWFELTDEDIEAIRLDPGFRVVDEPVKEPKAQRRLASPGRVKEESVDFYLGHDDEPWVDIKRCGIPPWLAMVDGLRVCVNGDIVCLRLADVIAWHERERHSSPWDAETLNAARGVLRKFECGKYVEV